MFSIHIAARINRIDDDSRVIHLENAKFYKVDFQVEADKAC
jgi:hypothetical protein